MSRTPSMPLFVADYLADTRHLSLAEHGAYCLLLMNMWSNGGTLPNDDARNARLLGVNRREWERIRASLLPFFETYGPEGTQTLTQKRLQKEWNYVQGVRASRSQAAKQAAAERWSRQQILNGTGTASSTASRMPQAMPNGQQNDATYTYTKKEIYSLSELDAARAETVESPQDQVEGRAAATALPSGAPPPSSEMPNLLSVLNRQGAPKKSDPATLLASLEKLERGAPFKPRTPETSALLRKATKCSPS